MSVPPRIRRPGPPGGIAGSCQCDAIGYEVQGKLTFLRNCHCSRCRRARGTAHATNTFVPLDLIPELVLGPLGLADDVSIWVIFAVLLTREKHRWQAALPAR